MAIPEIVTRECFSRVELQARYDIGKDAVAELLDKGILPRICVGKSQMFVPARALEAFEEELGREVARRLIQQEAERR